jgi:nicotinate-nucleotide adenylyltransferase
MILFGLFLNTGSCSLSSERQKKVGLFGGSFDPIHLGHLKMVQRLADSVGLDEVWFCPARISPHKLHDTPAAIEHRLKMVALAIEDDPRFSLLDIEAKREGPSYTIDTVKEMISKESDTSSPKQIYLILSDETLPDFFRWKDAEQIVRLVPLLIGTRDRPSPHPPEFEGKSQPIREAIKKGWHPTEPFNISSTEIRKRLHHGEDCKKFLPKKVLDYIYQNKLYF